MTKVDISITRSLTINTGNYESIKPTVTLTARDIDADKVDGAYLQMETVISGLMKFETLHCAKEAKFISSGLTQYTNMVENNADSIGQEIERALSGLNGL